MLKIKDNVDLKELENFNYYDCGNYYCKDNIYCVDKKTRECYMEIDYKYRSIAEYDLIIAGLVEKVEE